MYEYKPKKASVIKEVLWHRKVYNFLGALLTLFTLGINYLLGERSDLSFIITMCMSCSFIFGFFIYLILEDKERIKRDGKAVLFSKDGFFSFIMTFVTIIIMGFLTLILKQEGNQWVRKVRTEKIDLEQLVSG